MESGGAPQEASERSHFAAEKSAAREPVNAVAEQDAFLADDGAGREQARAGWFRQRIGLLRHVLERLPSALRAALALEVERGTPFVLVPVFLAIGAIAYFQLDFEPGLPALVGVAIPAMVLTILTRGRPPIYFVAAATALIAVGALLAKVETMRAGTKMLGGEISTVITGRVAGIDDQANGRTRLTVDLVSADRPKLRYAPDRIRASARKAPEGLAVGSMVGGIVKLQPPSGPVRPGSYDFSFESYFDDIGASGFFIRGPDMLASTDPSTFSDRFGAWVENARQSVAARVRARIGGPEGEIAAALMVGVRAGIPEEVNEALRRAGLYHIISISGLHMALVAGSIMGAARLCFALFPGFASRWPTKKFSAFAALSAIAFYLIFSGGEVAAQRSFIMLSVMLIAVLFDRAALTMRNLAISAIVVLVMSPHEIVGPSFQMSFAATAALVGAYAIWAERDARRSQAPPPPHSPLASTVRLAGILLLGMIATSVIAGLATAVYGAYHFQRVSPLSLAANLMATPVVSLLVMPAALFAAVAMPLGLDGFFLDLMGRGLTALIAIAEWFSARSPVDAVGLVSVWSVVLITAAIVVATMATTRLRLAAVPFAIAGILVLGMVRTPDVLVSEDGSIVALRLEGNAIATNRARANAFTLDNWKRALRAETVVKPVAHSDSDSGWQSGAFVCDDKRCIARHPSGAVIVHTSDAAQARDACGFARIIVLDDATVTPRCPDPGVLMVTTRQLALWGSAEIFLPGRKEEIPTVRQAIPVAGRPWHVHRQFSRAARGMASYQRQPKPPAEPSETATPPARSPTLRRQRPKRPRLRPLRLASFPQPSEPAQIPCRSRNRPSRLSRPNLSSGG